MGIIDDFHNLVTEFGAQGEALSPKVVPQSIQNLQIELEMVEKELGAFQAEYSAAQNDMQKSNACNRLIHIRILVQSLYSHLQDGGTPEPNPAYKVHPLYKSVASRFVELNKILAKWEEEALGCTYGFKQPDGSIINPALGVTSEEFAAIKNQSTDQTARCWRHDDPSQYY